MKSFSERINALMTSRKLTQVALAPLCDTTQSTVNRWLGGSVPRGSMSRKLCAALCVAPEWLFSGFGDMTPVPKLISNQDSLLTQILLRNPHHGVEILQEKIAALPASTGAARGKLLHEINELSEIMLGNHSAQE